MLRVTESARKNVGIAQITNHTYSHIEYLRSEISAVWGTCAFDLQIIM